MATRRANSAQDEWLRHPHLTWWRAFPGFAASLNLLADLVQSEARLLALAAAAMVAMTFGASMVASYYSANWTNLALLRLVETWPLIAVALVGGWTSLGSRAWHMRFLVGCLAAAWLIVVHLAGPHTLGAMRFYEPERFTTVALATFLSAAFGGAWVGSIGRCALVGPRPPRRSMPLGRGQFGLDAILWAMLLVAAVLGLWQLVQGWFDAGSWIAIRHLEQRGALAQIAVAVVASLVALSAGFSRGKTMLAACSAWMLVLFAASGFGLIGPGRETVLPGAASLGLALAVVGLLRAGGMRRVRTPSVEVDAHSAAEHVRP